MCGVTVRPMKAEDVPVLAVLERENFSDPWSEASFEAELANPHGITLTAETAAGIAGYLNAFLVGGNLHINTFCVDEGQRGKGIASMLMERLLEKAVSEGAEDATLEVREGNAPALALYRKYGFVPVGVRKRFYREPEENAVLMKKEFVYG